MRILHLPVNRKKAEGGKPDYGVYRFSRAELFVLFAEAAAAGFLVVWLVYDSVFGLPAGIAAGMLIIRMKRKDLIRRQKQTVLFHFRDFIFSLNAAFKSGYSLENALAASAKDLESLYGGEDLTVREVRDIAAKVRYRLPAPELFADWADRSGTEDIRQFAEMIAISSKTGGRITKILSDSWKTICERIDTKKETDSMLASKIYEQKLISIMPAFIIIYLRISFAGLISVLYRNLPGVIIMSICLFVYGLAVVWSRKIVEIEL